MRRRALAAIALGLGALAQSADAQPYRWTDQHGVTHYSDRRPQPAPGPVEDLNARAQPQPSPRPALAAPPPVATTESRGTRRPPTATTLPSPTPTGPTVALSGETPPPQETPLFALSRPGQRTDPASRRALELLDLAGLDRQVDYLAGTVRQEVRDLGWRSYAPDSVRATIGKAFHRDLLAERFLESFTREADTARLEAALAWYRSPLGRRFSEQRRDFSPAERAAYWTFVRSLPETPPSPARVALVHRMDRAWRASEIEPETVRMVRRTLHRILARRAQPRPDRQTREPDRGRDEARRFHLVSSTLYRYETFTEEELRRHVDFLESADGAWFIRAVRDGLRASLAAAEERAAAMLPPRG